MIASLGMYDLPQVQGANDAFWALIRDGLREAGRPAPEALSRGDTAYWAAWEDPTLVLSQTCGYPFRARLHGRVTLVGTPDFGLPGCPPGHYNSVFVVRKGDPRERLGDFGGAAFAYNEALSQSGWAAPQSYAMGIGLRLVPRLCTGAHAGSAEAVAQGRADIAAIDAATWELLLRWRPFTADLREVGRTPPTPGLPYIAGPGADAALLFGVIAEAIAALSPAHRAALLLKGIEKIPAEAYLAVPNPPSPEAMMASTRG